MYRKREYSLWGEKVVLVPYLPHHVPRYHQWMQDPVLQFQTGSEPLTLEQEYDMQRKWLADEDKCTFICLCRARYEEEGVSEVDSMAGDVNLFFNDSEDPSLAEIELMIAEPSCRRRGMGLEAARLMMAYGISELGVKTYRAKIGTENKPSLQLFQRNLAFKKISCSEVFQEITLELAVSGDQLSSFSSLDISSKWKKYIHHIG